MQSKLFFINYVHVQIRHRLVTEMKKILFTNIFILLSFGLSISSPKKINKLRNTAIHELKKLVNYKRMNPVDSADFIQQRIHQLLLQENLDIPKRLQIPVELMSYRKKGDTHYFIKYNTGKNTKIAYIPSDIASTYEIEAWRDFQKNGVNSPLLSIILAQQFTESGFNPYLTGDGGKSCGLPQLHRPTAKWLTKVDPLVWNKIFYWDKNNIHHFLSLEAQIQFPYIFLPQYKRYSNKKIFEGLRRYNGAGKNARRYARTVIKRSLQYLELMQQYNLFVEDTTKLFSNLYLVINMGLINKGEAAINQQEMRSILDQIKTEFSSIKSNISLKQEILNGNAEQGGNKFFVAANYEIPNDGKEYFIVIEQGRTLFSYFQKTSEMLNVLNHSNNHRFFCYFWKRGKQKIIHSQDEMRGKQIFSNTHNGDHIYIPPGTKIFSPEADIVTEIRG